MSFILCLAISSSRNGPGGASPAAPETGAAASAGWTDPERQRPVVDVFRHTKEQLVAPEKVRRRFFRNHAHRFGQKFLALGGFESLTLLFQ